MKKVHTNNIENERQQRKCGKIEMMTLTKKGIWKKKQRNWGRKKLPQTHRRNRNSKRIKHGENVCNMSGIKNFLESSNDSRRWWEFWCLFLRMHGWDIRIFPLKNQVRALHTEDIFHDRYLETFFVNSEFF